jgi:hypothetical protein
MRVEKTCYMLAQIIQRSDSKSSYPTSARRKLLHNRQIPLCNIVVHSSENILRLASYTCRKSCPRSTEKHHQFMSPGKTTIRSKPNNHPHGGGSEDQLICTNDPAAAYRYFHKPTWPARSDLSDSLRFLFRFRIQFALPTTRLWMNWLFLGVLKDTLQPTFPNNGMLPS